MEAHQIRKGVYWVGGIDWDLRNFHGYLTQRGSTYNAYLILDESVVLVDTVKHSLFDEMGARIQKIVDSVKIDDIVSNHEEGIFFSKNLMIQPGLEFYGKIGELSDIKPLSRQRHYIFPTLDFFIARRFRWHTGAGFGLTRASDKITFKSILSIIIKF